MTTGVQPVKARVAKEKVPTFKQFERATFQDTDGQYIVNGDEPISSTHSLRTYYRQVFDKAKQDQPAQVAQAHRQHRRRRRRRLERQPGARTSPTA